MIAFFSLTVFMAELTLDASTAFVRADSVVHTWSADSNANQNSSAPFSKKEGGTGHITVESTAHAALPVVHLPLQFWREIANENHHVEFLIPSLNPPISRIERPPIS